MKRCLAPAKTAIACFILSIFVVTFFPGVSHGSDALMEQLIELRRELFRERLEVEESLTGLSPEEQRAKMAEWRFDNADLFDAIGELVMELSPPANGPVEIPQEDWQRQVAELPPNLREFFEARRAVSLRLLELAQSGTAISDEERAELSIKLSEGRELARGVQSEGMWTPAFTPEERTTPESLSPPQAAAFELRSALSSARARTQRDLEDASPAEQTRALREWIEENAPALHELRLRYQ